MSTLVTVEGTLTPRAPFDFVKTLQFIGDFTPTEGEQTVVANRVIQFFNEVDEHYLRTADYDEVAARIRAIRGICEWSAYFILIRGLGRVEHTTFSGKELTNAASTIYGREMTPAEIQRVIERYGTNQGYWSFYVRAGTFLGYNMVACTTL